MKAIQITQTGSADILQYIDIDRPVAGPDQVLVKVEAIGVNYADVLVRQGAIPTAPFPVVPGEEYSGTIEAVGYNVTDYTPGQRVAVLLGHGPDSGHVSAGYAEYAVAEASSVIPIPDAIGFDTAAAILANYLTAYFLLHHSAHIKSGQSILLHAAAGGGGTAMIQLAKLAGINVIGLTSSDGRVDYAKSQGAMEVINYRNEDVYKSVMDITNGCGVDVIFNSAGGNTLTRDFSLLAPFGQIVWYGTAAGIPEVNLMQLLIDGFHEHKGIKTFLLHAMLQYKPEIWRQAANTIIKYLVDGKIQPHVHKRFVLAEAARAHRLLETSQIYGKLILTPKAN